MEVCLVVVVAAARAAPVVLVVANRGILFGPCFILFPLDGESDVVVVAIIPARRMFAAPAVDRVTRVGRCSDAVTPRAGCFDTVLDLLRVAGAFKAGRISFSSSSSVSSTNLFALGVFRGCPGGAIDFAFAVAVATCRLGVTGGNDTVFIGGVASRVSISSSVSAGGVAGVTSAAGGFIEAACCFFISSAAAHLTHSSCLRYMYCCWGPTTLPGRTIRINAITSLAVNPYFQMRYAPMRVPVLPRPALHYQSSEDNHGLQDQNANLHERQQLLHFR